MSFLIFWKTAGTDMKVLDEKTGIDCFRTYFPKLLFFGDAIFCSDYIRQKDFGWTS